MPTVALAGYTNVGKSTLLNALTGADVSVNDRLFETLDPTTRAFREDGRTYPVTDTVGFIRKLPHGLVEAFAATLEETLAADLVLLVADGSGGEDDLVDQLTEVRSGAVGHRCRRPAPDHGAEQDRQARQGGPARLGNRFGTAVQVSAATGENLEQLKHRIAEFFQDRFVDVRLLMPHQTGRQAVGAVCQRRADHRA